MVLKGHFDGERVVLDEPAPKDLSPNTPVEVLILREAPEPVLARVVRLARAGGMPADYAEQHEHYVKGTPRR